MPSRKQVKKWTIRGTVILVTCGIISTGIVTIINSRDLIQSYNATKHWKHKDPTKLASLPASLVNANDKTKQALSQYNDCESEIWDSDKHDFKSNIKSYDIRNLNYFYKQLDDKTQETLTNYNEIITLWNIKHQFENYTKNNTISAKTDITKLNAFITDSFSTLQPYLLDTITTHTAAETLYTNLTTLANDSNQYAHILDMVSQDYKLISKNKLTTDMEQEHVNALNAEINKLHYSWEFITTTLSPIISNSASAINKNTDAHTKYNAYLKDQENQKSFETYLNQYKNTLKELQEQIIELPDFTDKPLSDVQAWCETNNIALQITHKTSSKTENTVLEQTPSHNDYTKIVKGSTLKVIISEKEKVSRETSSSSSSTTQSSSKTETSNSKTETAGD